MNWQLRPWIFRVLAASCSAAASCGASGPDAVVTPTATTAAPPTTGTTTTSTTGPVPATIEISIQVLDHTAGTPDFADEVVATLTDPRGWEQAGFRFVFDDEAAPYTVVLAEADEVDALCLPYDTFGLYSCQIGPVVALNADRWRTATPEWTDAGGDLATYRQMLVNHEVGHLLGQHHPDPQCPAPGEPAPVMAQQSTELPETGCLPNPWPLPWEIECAAEHVEPLAPPYEPDAVATCTAQR